MKKMSITWEDDGGLSIDTEGDISLTELTSGMVAAYVHGEMPKMSNEERAAFIGEVIHTGRVLRTLGKELGRYEQGTAQAGH